MSSKTVRSSRRFNPDAGKFALLDFQDPKQDFEPQIPALIVDEAETGLGLVVLTAAELEVGDEIRLQLNHEEDVRNATVRWVKEIDDTVVNIGIEYEG